MAFCVYSHQGRFRLVGVLGRGPDGVLIQSLTVAGAETLVKMSDIRSIKELIEVAKKACPDVLAKPAEKTRFDGVPIDKMREMWRLTA